MTMRLDDWTTEAHRSLQEWNPEPANPPTAPTVRPEVDDLSSTDPILIPACVEPSPVRGRQPASTGRRLLSAAAVVVLVAAAAAFVAQVAQVVTPADNGVATGPQTEPPHAAGEPSPADPGAGPSSSPRFSCTAADQKQGAPTDGFDDSADVADWRARDIGQRPAASAAPNFVTGTLIGSPGEDVAGTTARAEAFVAALAPGGWSCTVESSTVDVADPSRAGPILDQTDTLTNRLGGRCLVPDASATPDSVWGVAPSLAAALDHVDGLTSWSVVLADGGGNGQGPGRLWMEFMFEADPADPDHGPINRVLADVSAAVDAAGTAAGVPTDCSVH
jgi:hypothetical protein